MSLPTSAHWMTNLLLASLTVHWGGCTGKLVFANAGIAAANTNTLIKTNKADSFLIFIFGSFICKNTEVAKHPYSYRN
jgi:hypothetical protein